jgi:ELWxxDGT repeat protein
MVQDVFPGPGSSSPEGLTAVAGTLYFSAGDESHGRELWKSDGTERGTVLVRDIAADGSSFPQQMTNVAGTLFFAADDGIHGYELWKSDGTEAGTVLVRDIAVEGSSGPQQLTNLAGTLFFAADDGIHGVELWKSDGTEAGTVLVRDIRPGGASGSPEWATYDDNSNRYDVDDAIVAGTLYFTADDGVHGRELWRTDGTPAGTRLMHDIVPGPPASSIGQITAIGPRVFFSADGSTLGEPLDQELWVMPLHRLGTGLAAASRPSAIRYNRRAVAR